MSKNKKTKVTPKKPAIDSNHRYDQVHDEVIPVGSAYPSLEEAKKSSHLLSHNNIHTANQALRNTFAIAQNAENLTALHNRLDKIEDAYIKLNETLLKLAELQRDDMLSKMSWGTKLIHKLGDTFIQNEETKKT